MSDYAWLRELGFGLFFSVLGTLFVVPGVLVFRDSFLKLLKWTTVPGTIVSYQEVQPSREYDATWKTNRFFWRSDADPVTRKQTAFDPQVQFALADGKLIRFTSTTGSNIKFHRVGASIQVLYDPQAPETAVIKSFSSLFLGPVLLTLIGLVLFGVALWPLFQTGHR